MEVKTCRDCGRLFNYVGGQRLCPNCRGKLEEKFIEVRQYVKDNKNATVKEVSEAMEVSVQQIRQWVREERLSFTDDSQIGIDCEKCGKMIKTGKYCETCKREVLANLSRAYPEKKKAESVKDKRESSRMRYLDK